MTRIRRPTDTQTPTAPARPSRHVFEDDPEDEGQAGFAPKPEVPSAQALAESLKHDPISDAY